MAEEERTEVVESVATQEADAPPSEEAGKAEDQSTSTQGTSKQTKSTSATVSTGESDEQQTATNSSVQEIVQQVRSAVDRLHAVSKTDTTRVPPPEARTSPVWHRPHTEDHEHQPAAQTDDRSWVVGSIVGSLVAMLTAYVGVIWAVVGAGEPGIVTIVPPLLLFGSVVGGALAGTTVKSRAVAGMIPPLLTGLVIAGITGGLWLGMLPALFFTVVVVLGPVAGLFGGLLSDGVAELVAIVRG